MVPPQKEKVEDFTFTSGLLKRSYFDIFLKKVLLPAFFCSWAMIGQALQPGYWQGQRGLDKVVMVCSSLCILSPSVVGWPGRKIDPKQRPPPLPAVTWGPHSGWWLIGPVPQLHRRTSAGSKNNTTKNMTAAVSHFPDWSNLPWRLMYSKLIRRLITT